MTKKTSKPNLVVVPTSWAIYDIGDVAVEEFGGGIPTMAVLESLAIIGKIKRVAAIHTLNTMHEPEGEDERESPFEAD